MTVLTVHEKPSLLVLLWFLMLVIREEFDFPWVLDQDGLNPGRQTLFVDVRVTTIAFAVKC